MREIVLNLDLPKERQTLLFSATFTSAVQKLINDFTRNPEKIVVGTPSACKQVEQRLMVVSEQQKYQTLTRLLEETQED